MLDYGSPFGFFFKDRDWLKKFMIASLLTYTIIGAAPVIGWTIETARRVGRGEEHPLPELNDWKSFWSLGGKFALVNAVWLLPLLFAVTLLYLPLIFANSIPPELVLVVFGGTLCCDVVFLSLYGILYAFFFPVMLVMLANGSSVCKTMNPLQLWKAARLHIS
jgi:hypothetical protein